MPRFKKIGRPGHGRLGEGDEMVSRVIDVHTHLYPRRYMELMRERSDVPKVVRRDGNNYLIILPGEDKGDHRGSGRLMDRNYWSPEAKLEFMDQSGIDVSVLSLANPWLDFLAAQEAIRWAVDVNDDFERICAESNGRLFALAALPTSAGADACVTELERISDLPHMRGIILSTHGLGRGLDDPGMAPVWTTLVDLDMVVFVHPHYGVGNELYSDYGHSLYLALGFTFETTVAAAKIALSGVLDRYDGIKLLLAHGGGTVPFLAGRLDSCVAHDEYLEKPSRKPSESLRRALLDAVVYSEDALRLVVSFSGEDKVLFGTDHPFSISEVSTVLGTIDSVAGNDDGLRKGLRGANAARWLRLG
jgi:aminocarboxymuconate-semialdehyde decarboxylase